MSTSSEKEKEVSEETIDKEKTVVNFDTVLNYIGPCGRYQILLVLMAYYMCLPCGMHQVAAVFLAAIPPYRCFIPGVDDNPAYNTTSNDDILNATTPYANEKYDTCNFCNYNWSECKDDLLTCRNTEQECVKETCTEYVYDKSVYESTVTTEWDLVCDRLIVGTVVTSTYYLGVLFSALIGGNIADLIGRGPTLLIGQMGMMAVGIGCAFSPSLAAFAATRFTVALFLMASYVAGFVYVMEITSGKWRTIVGINIQAAFAVGYMIMSGLAYEWRDWRDLQIAISLVSLPSALLWIFMPESPRWLFSKGKDEKAKRISHMMAKKNGVTLPDNIWEVSLIEEHKEYGKSFSPVVLFRRPRMRIITINMMFVWFVVSLVYYGISLNVGNLAGDDYVNNTLSGLVALISYPIVTFTIDIFGRKTMLSASLFFGGVSCLGSTVANQFAGDNQDVAMVGTALALCGKMAVAGSFAIIYNYTAELYPTVIRSTAVGFGSMSARAGSVLTPYTIYLQYAIPWLTNTIFGLLALAAGATSLFFPETLGARMLTTLDEAETFYAHPEYHGTSKSVSSESSSINYSFVETVDKTISLPSEGSLTKGTTL